MATARKPVRKNSAPKKELPTAPRVTVDSRHTVVPASDQSERNFKPMPADVQKENLEKEHAQVNAELTRLRAELQEAPEATGDEVDLNVYEREKTLGLIASYERRLAEIERARRAAQKGKYGICEQCGNPIDPARLEIFPETRLCVKCKNESERMTRRRTLG